jgi:protein-tyrosine phosphatase
MSRIAYDGAGELHITNITEACQMPKDDLDRVITVCQDSIKDNVPESVEYSFYCMSDGPANEYGGNHSYAMFAEAADELYEALTTDETVLIHCHAGQSRSVSVATAVVGRMLDLSRSDALDLIHRYRITQHYPDRLLMDHASQYISEHTEHDIPFGEYEGS